MTGRASGSAVGDGALLARRGRALSGEIRVDGLVHDGGRTHRGMTDRAAHVVRAARPPRRRCAAPRRASGDGPMRRSRPCRCGPSTSPGACRRAPRFRESGRPVPADPAVDARAAGVHHLRGRGVTGRRADDSQLAKRREVGSLLEGHGLSLPKGCRMRRIQAGCGRCPAGRGSGALGRRRRPRRSWVFAATTMVEALMADGADAHRQGEPHGREQARGHRDGHDVVAGGPDRFWIILR